RVRRGRENGAAVAAIGRMADPVDRPLRKEDSLIDVGGHAATAEMLAERAMSHEHNGVVARVFFGRRAAARVPAVVIAHADDGALVERAVGERVFGPCRHKEYCQETTKLANEIFHFPFEVCHLSSSENLLFPVGEKAGFQQNDFTSMTD